MERIQKAKQGLLTRVENDKPERSQSVASSPLKSVGVESARAKRRKVDSVQSPQDTKRELDWEDLIVEYLLLRGVSKFPFLCSIFSMVLLRIRHHEQRGSIY